jgi:hypothetical protein
MNRTRYALVRLGASFTGSPSTELGKILEVLVLEYDFGRTRTRGVRTRTRGVGTRTRTRRFLSFEDDCN